MVGEAKPAQLSARCAVAAPSGKAGEVGRGERLLESLREGAAVDPIPDREAATRLGEELRAIGYGERGVVDLLGEDGPGTDDTEVPVRERRLDDSLGAASASSIGGGWNDRD